MSKSRKSKKPKFVPQYAVGDIVRYNPEGEGERSGQILVVDEDGDMPFAYEIEDPEEPGLARSWPVQESEILGLVH